DSIRRVAESGSLLSFSLGRSPGLHPPGGRERFLAQFLSRPITRTPSAGWPRAVPCSVSLSADHPDSIRRVAESGSLFNLTLGRPGRGQCYARPNMRSTCFLSPP